MLLGRRECVLQVFPVFPLRYSFHVHQVWSYVVDDRIESMAISPTWAKVIHLYAKFSENKSLYFMHKSKLNLNILYMNIFHGHGENVQNLIHSFKLYSKVQRFLSFFQIQNSLLAVTCKDWQTQVHV